MLPELIELAEKIYARGENPYSAPDANAREFHDFGIELGHLIEEVGKTLNYYHHQILDQKMKMEKMQQYIKELENK
jgi:hypothetical protein